MFDLEFLSETKVFEFYGVELKWNFLDVMFEACQGGTMMLSREV